VKPGAPEWLSFPELLITPVMNFLKQTTKKKVIYMFILKTCLQPAVTLHSHRHQPIHEGEHRNPEAMTQIYVSRIIT
jgi:hypothetical protein